MNVYSLHVAVDLFFYAVIEQKILEETMLKKSQIIKHVLKPMITDGKLEKHNDAGKANFTKDNYTFI